MAESSARSLRSEAEGLLKAVEGWHVLSYYNQNPEHAVRVHDALHDLLARLSEIEQERDVLEESRRDLLANYASVRTAYEASVLAFSDLQRERTWKCKAQLTADPPQDCDWPSCGCDPYADKVLAALEEAAPGLFSIQRDNEQLRKALSSLQRERDEALRKSEIDQRQCDEMTSRAGELVQQLSDLQERHENLKTNEARVREHYLKRLADLQQQIRELVSTMRSATYHFWADRLEALISGGGRTREGQEQA